MLLINQQSLRLYGKKTARWPQSKCSRCATRLASHYYFAEQRGGPDSKCRSTNLNKTHDDQQRQECLITEERNPSYTWWAMRLGRARSGNGQGKLFRVHGEAKSSCKYSKNATNFNMNYTVAFLCALISYIFKYTYQWSFFGTATVVPLTSRIRDAFILHWIRAGLTK